MAESTTEPKQYDIIHASDVTTVLDRKAPKDHAHGNLTNDGAIGNEPDKLVATSTGGLITTADSLSATPLAAGSAPSALSCGSPPCGLRSPHTFPPFSRSRS